MYQGDTLTIEAQRNLGRVRFDIRDGGITSRVVVDASELSKALAILGLKEPTDGLSRHSGDALAQRLTTEGEAP